MEKFQGNLKDLEVLSKGYWGTTYILSDTELLKCSVNMTQEMVMDEFNRGRASFEAGIPCVETKRAVETEEGIGVICERVTSGSIGRNFAAHPENGEAYLKAYIDITKKMWSTKIPEGKLPRVKDDYLKITDRLGEILLDDKLVEEYVDLINRLPDADTFVHMDMHLSNVMYNDGNAKLIDMSYASVGSPLFDLLTATLFFDEWKPEYLFDGKTYQSLFRITPDQAAWFWKGLCRELFAGLPEKVAQERIEALEKLSVIVYTKNNMRDYSLGICSEGMQKVMRDTMTNLLTKDKDFVLRVVSEWFK